MVLALCDCECDIGLGLIRRAIPPLTELVRIFVYYKADMTQLYNTINKYNETNTIKFNVQYNVVIYSILKMKSSSSSRYLGKTV